jgi:hypothetical protein
MAADPLGTPAPSAGAAPAPALPHLLVCPNCGRTLALDPDAATVRLAVAADTVGLTPDHIAALKALRPKL